MNITSTIITASDGTPLSLYDVCRFLSKQQWKHILKQLKQEGIHIERIEAYEYPEVRDIKHLFIRFEKEKEDTPFYLLSPEIFSKLTNAIIQEYSSPDGTRSQQEPAIGRPLLRSHPHPCGCLYERP